MCNKSYYSILFISLFLFSCKRDIPSEATVPDKQIITGKTMGTTYSIVYIASSALVTKETIDSILVVINNSASTYIENSTISKINRNNCSSTKTITYLDNSKEKTRIKCTLPYDEIFIRNYEASKRIYLETNGAFDPSVMPLVNYWGFGYKDQEAITPSDTQAVNKILENVGLEKFEVNHDLREMTIIKPEKGQLDFSAIAKGYAVDFISDYLANLDIKDHMVEIGGEIFAKGLNDKKEKWSIGLNKPKDHSFTNSIQDIVSITDKGLASSGNYRNFKIIDGVKYGHEINPTTGYPEITDLLGVSVVSSNTMYADGYATAIMIMGQKQAIDFIDANPNTEAILYHSGQNEEIISSYSENAKELIAPQKQKVN